MSHSITALNATQRACIESGFQTRNAWTADHPPAGLKSAVESALTALDTGQARVAYPHPETRQWTVDTALKMACVLYFKFNENQRMPGQTTHYFDKVPLKYATYTQAQFHQDRVRVVPPAHVRYGAYVAPRTVLMPCYVNIGAFIDTGSMIDTWATVGSCAQIGKNVHLSGGAGIGGVLEPLQATPTIIEDNCFIGARSEIVEGVIVERHAVISMGVYLSQSTKIYDRRTGKISYGRIPEGAVVVPGSLPDKHGGCHLYCAVIVKQVDARTREKTSINALLRSDDA